MKRFGSIRSMSTHSSLNRRLGIAALVGLLHLGVIYAIVTGLTLSGALTLPNILQVQVFRDKSKPTPPIVAPETPELLRPQVPVVRAPIIKIATLPEPRRSITVLQGPRPSGPEVPMAAIRNAPAPISAKLPSRSASALVGTHTTPPYPEISRRLGEQGSVTLSISVDPTGHVSDVLVLNSSGYQRLDEAAVSWVQSHWRYRPAVQGGAAVKSVVSAKIVFDLRNA